MRATSVALVGLHGQTILHRPREGLTRQLCDGARAAAALGIDVVADFRSADVKAGGEGAPLAPVYHAAMAAGLERPLMILNWGGVGNVTYLGLKGEIIAFDTGPANALIDDFLTSRRGLAFDDNGMIAASGRVDPAALAMLMGDPYFDRPAPKSLDRNHFSALAACVESLSDADGAATLSAFTVESTAAALRHVPQAPARWLVGVRSRFFADAPAAFYYLPERLRLEAVRRTLGPSGGWFIRDKVVGKVPLHLGCTPQGAEVKDGRVHLSVQAMDGSKREIVTEHIIAATGYKVDLERLKFLNPEIRSQLKTVGGSPVLSSTFESSMPGLYFAGVAAANSFGPVMRFAFGAGFAARTLTRALAKSVAKEPASVAVRSVATSAK